MAQPENVDKLLKDLQGTTAFKRGQAARQLGSLTESNEQIVEALIATSESDGYDNIKEAAATALLAPAHQAIISQHFEWSMYLTENLTQTLQENSSKALSENLSGRGIADTKQPQFSEVAQRHLKKAYQLNEAGKSEAALQECEAVIPLAPEWGEAHNLRGLILDNLGQTEQAIEAYQQAILLDPKLEDAQSNLVEAKKELHGQRLPDIPKKVHRIVTIRHLKNMTYKTPQQCCMCGEPVFPILHKHKVEVSGTRKSLRLTLDMPLCDRAHDARAFGYQLFGGGVGLMVLAGFIAYLNSDPLFLSLALGGWVILIITIAFTPKFRKKMGINMKLKRAVRIKFGFHRADLYPKKIFSDRKSETCLVFRFTNKQFADAFELANDNLLLESKNASLPPNKQKELAISKSQSHLEDAYAYVKKGNLSSALAKTEIAIRLNKNCAEAFNYRSIILEKIGQKEEAAEARQTAIGLDPAFSEINTFEQANQMRYSK